MLPEGKGIAAGCDNASWEVYDVGSNTQCARGKVKSGRCESIAASASGRFLYMGWDSIPLMMADTYTPDVQMKLDKAVPEVGKYAHTDMVKGLAMSPTGDGLLSASFDGTCKLWAM